jgi:hypothetical protein
MCYTVQKIGPFKQVTQEKSKSSRNEMYEEKLQDTLGQIIKQTQKLQKN